MIVWASPAEHETIRAALDKLGGGPTGDPLTSPQLEVYRLTRVDPTKLIDHARKAGPRREAQLRRAVAQPDRVGQAGRSASDPARRWPRSRPRATPAGGSAAIRDV